jgi:septal ring factor EnvC (AmiA/AmiB activator)
MFGDRLSNLKGEIHTAELGINSIQQKITNLYKDNGYQISRLETLEEQKQELTDKRKEFAAYDLYLKAMHPNGISYDVIKQKLPVINNEINKILAS